MDYKVEIRERNDDGKLVVSVCVIELPVDRLKNLEHIKEYVENAVSSYLELVTKQVVNCEKSQGIQQRILLEKENL